MDSYVKALRQAGMVIDDVEEGRLPHSYAWFLDMRDDRIIRASASFDSVAFNEFWTRVTPSE